MRRRVTCGLLGVLLPVLLLALPPARTQGHGSTQNPISRYYACYLEGPETPDTPACRDAIAAGGTQPLYDWNEVSIMTAGGRHREIIPDGKLCSAGRAKYAAFDVPRADWATTIMPASGNYTFVYSAYVPHNQGYFELYVTRDGYDPLQPLSWADLEATPFARFDNPPLVNGTYVMSGALPAGKSGKHLIYTIWQRNDSLEAFYACSDVWFGSSPTPTPTQAPACTSPAWNSTTIYQAADQVSHAGRQWRAKWGNSSTEPSTDGISNPWEILGFCSSGGPTPTSGSGATPTSTPVPQSSTATATRTSTAGPTATPDAATNLLRNPSFELDANGDGDPDNWTSHASVTRSNGARSSGAYSLRHFSTSNNNYIIAQTVTGIAANSAYTFRGWTNIPATADTFTYRLELVWRNSSNGTIRTDQLRSFTAATDGWSQTSVSRTAPAGTTNVVVRMNVVSLNATIYADDFWLASAASGTPSPSASTRPTTPTAPTSTSVIPTSTRTRTPTATQQPSGCTGLTICDDFEAQTVGAAPGGGWQVLYPSCQGTGSVVVDAAQARSGGKSIRVDGKAGFCNHVFFGNTTSVAGIGPVVYGRFFVRATGPLQDGHVTFAALRDANDGDKDLRLGGQNQVMTWNRESDDATIPQLSPAGVARSKPLPAGQWACVEFMVDGTSGYLQTWLDGVEVEGLRVDDTATADVDAQWKSKTDWHPSLSDLKLGWESYAGGENTLWFDDVALGAQRVGCGEAPPATPTRTATTGTAVPTPTRTSVVLTPTPTGGPATGLRVQYKAAETMATANQIKPHLNIVNGGTASVALSELKARYYYSKEGTAGEQYFCDYAVLGCGNVTGSFAAGYLEIGFSSGAGSLAPGGQSGEIQSRFSKTDWSNYTQTGDYSFDPTRTAFADWSRVTLYRSGTLVWGTTP